MHSIFSITEFSSHWRTVLWVMLTAYTPSCRLLDLAKELGFERTRTLGLFLLWPLYQSRMCPP